jgi:para-aminobenzoate synthetase component 1
LWSGTTDTGQARFSIFAASPHLVFRWKNGVGRAAGPDGVERLAGRDPFSWLAEIIGRNPCDHAPPWPFHGGAIGHVSYDAARDLEAFPTQAADDRPHDWLDFSLYSWAINWDHHRRRWAVLATGAPAGSERERGRRAASLCKEVARWAVGNEPADGPAFHRAGEELPGIEPMHVLDSLDRVAYLDAVEAVKARIEAGDCYEVNLSRRLTYSGNVDGRSLFESLARRNPAPFAAYLESSNGILVGSSPERFLSVRGGHAQSRPIKGTSGRSADPEEDRRSAGRLRSSEKDRAENIMIVDVVRNDLGRVCRPGTIRVTDLCRLESYSGVHHLVSSVGGILQDGCGALDAARALFPAGSMTGAPKIRSMEIIESLEPVRRGPYAGAAGYVSAAGDLDFSVVIRSFLISPGLVDLQVGGAVVADSSSEAEFRESEVKGERARAALQEALSR